MKSILKYVLLNSLRDKLYLGIFAALICTFALAFFLGSTNFVEGMQTTIVYIASGSRLIIALGLTLFICLNINHSFENKEIDFILSKSVSREKFILAYLSGFFIITALILSILLLAILLLFNIDKIGLLAWFLTIFAELLILISFAFLASLMLKNVFLAIFTSFGFYFLSRMMGIFIFAINLPEDFLQAKNHLLPTTLKLLSIIFPRLDLYGRSDWLIYGINNDFFILKIVAIQASIFFPLMVFMAFHDFRKKQF